MAFMFTLSTSRVAFGSEKLLTKIRIAVKSSCEYLEKNLG